MRIFKLLIMLFLLVPVISIMGTIASSAQTLGPISVGPYTLQFDEIAKAGESMSAATEGLMRKQVALIVNFIQHEKVKKLISMDEALYRIEAYAKKNV